MDFGIRSHSYLNDKLNWAFTVANLGKNMTFDQTSESLRLPIKLGSAYKIREAWLADFDLAFPKGGGSYGALGTEYRIPIQDQWTLAGRAAWASGPSTSA